MSKTINPYASVQPKTRKPYTVVYLVRHANPEYSLQKKLGDAMMPLSLEGRKQAKAVAERLSRLGIDNAYTSNFSRAQETAAVFGNKQKIKIEVDQRLNEINWKDWHRVKYFKTSEERRKQHLPEYRLLDRQLDNMQAKTRRILADIYTKHKGERVVLFCHGNIIKTLLTSIMNADVLGFLSFEIYQGSISKLVIDRDGYVKISFINDAHHLPTYPEEDLFITLKD